MTKESRDKVWEKSFVTYYDCYFEEMISESLVYRWGVLDDITKVLVALTASSSVVAGWTLWNVDGFKIVWLILAGFAAFLSIIHATLNVQSKVKEWEGLKKEFTELRINIETFRHKMEIDPEFDIEEFTQEFESQRSKFAGLMKRLNGDITRTKGFELKIQGKLNLRLSDQIQNGG